MATPDSSEHLTHSIEVVVNAVVDFTDAEWQEIAATAERFGYSVENLLADESSLWWDRLSAAAAGGDIEVTLLDDDEEADRG